MEGLVVTSSGTPVSQGNAGPCPPARLLPLSPAFVAKIKGIDIAANNHPRRPQGGWSSLVPADPPTESTQVRSRTGCTSWMLPTPNQP